MKLPKHYCFSVHARKRAIERGITEALFVEVISNPDEKKQQYRGEHGGWVYLFTKQVKGKDLQIAAELYKDECFFVTGFWND